MKPDRAAAVARIIATAVARQSSAFDLFCALLAARATEAELQALGELLPVLAGYPAYATGCNALRDFETRGIAPPLALAGPHIDSLVGRARRAAAERQLMDEPETQPAAWVDVMLPTRPQALAA